MAGPASRLRQLTAPGSSFVASALRQAHLTTTGGVLVVLALGCWFLARRIGARALFLLVYLAALAMLASYLVARRRLAVELERSSISLRMREGQTATVGLTLRAARRLSTVILQESLDPVLGPTVQVPLASMAAGEVLEHQYRFTPSRRGVYRVGPARAVWSDPFGLTVHEQLLAEPVEVIVHPATEGVHDRVLSRMWEDPPIRPPVSKPWPTGFEFYGMRDYVPGDDLRRVVWAAVAKTDQMLVRESEQGITDRVVILLDTDGEWHSPETPSDTFETGVRAAASLGARHLNDGFSVSFVTNDGPRLTNLRGTGSRLPFLDDLARVQPTRTTFSGLAPSLLGESRRGSHLVVLTPHLDREAASTVRLALERGSSVTVAALVWDETDPQLLARAAALGCEVVQVPTAASLEAVFAHQIGAGIRA
ncbi:MAG: DUF58 domain-containing protein [Acidimicrobiales bacterium]